MDLTDTGTGNDDSASVRCVLIEEARFLPNPPTDAAATEEEGDSFVRSNEVLDEAGIAGNVLNVDGTTGSGGRKYSVDYSGVLKEK